MNSTLVTAYRIIVLLLLGYLAFQLYILKRDLKATFNEIDMVISKLDYVESDINSPK